MWERGLELLPVTKKEEKVHANDEEDEEKREPTESPHRPGPHPLLQGSNTLESFVGNLRHKYYAEIVNDILFHQFCFADQLSGIGLGNMACLKFQNFVKHNLGDIFLYELHHSLKFEIALRFW